MWCRVPETSRNKRHRAIHYSFNGKVTCTCLPSVRNSIELLELVPEEEVRPENICQDCLFIMLAKNMKGIQWTKELLAPLEYKSIIRVRRDYEFLMHLLPAMHKKFSASH